MPRTNGGWKKRDRLETCENKFSKIISFLLKEVRQERASKSRQDYASYSCPSRQLASLLPEACARKRSR